MSFGCIGPWTRASLVLTDFSEGSPVTAEMHLSSLAIANRIADARQGYDYLDEGFPT